MSIAAGQNYYNLKIYDEQRLSHWLRLNGQIQLFGRSYVSGYCGYDWGSDVHGYRVLAEVGYRF